MYMRRVMVDTSSMVFAFSNRKDIFAIVEERLDATPTVSAGIIGELKKLSARRSKEGRAAKLALRVIKKHRIRALENSEQVDDFLVRAAVDEGFEVCTNDIGLKRRLRNMGVRALSISKSGVLR